MPTVSCFLFVLVSVVLRHLQLIPLLLRGLDLPDESIHANVIDTFIAAAEGDTPEQSLVAEHVPSLISKMLKNSSIRDMPSMVCGSFSNGSSFMVIIIRE